MNTILAATDLSAPARHAVHRAGRLAQDTGAALHLLHVLSETGLENLKRMLGREATPVKRQLITEAEQALQALAAEIDASDAVDVTPHVVAGMVLKTILEQADDADADLLVVGARGEDFLRYLLLGSTTERLLRMTVRPALVVRQAPHEPYRRALVAVDFSPWSAAAVHMAGQVAPAAQIVLLHALELPFEGKLRYAGVDERTIEHYHAEAEAEAHEQMQGLIKQAGVDETRVEPRVERGRPPGVILAQEQEKDCDLIVMGKHGKTMLEELLLGSTTKHVVAEAANDVLVVPGTQ